MKRISTRWIGHTTMRAVPMLAVLLAIAMSARLVPVAAGPTQGPYKVLDPIYSGDMALFPVVRVDSQPAPANPFLTLDDGLRSGEVEVTEAGRVQGLIRPRSGQPQLPRYQGDQVNTLILVNHSGKPLLLLAGEVVTGGKQDRIVAKDRIVPPGSDPIDLSVFCIEPGRWTESSAQFGSSTKEASRGFMVQPKVRQEAMVAKDQHQVWNAVGGAISEMQAVTVTNAAPSVEGRPVATPVPAGVTSYAKAMQAGAVSAQVDKEEAPLLQSQERILASLQQEHAVGVVVAVHGEVIWADIFADTDLLTHYWSKLVRSYAAEELGASSGRHSMATQEAAQEFLAAPAERTIETSEGETGVYRYSEVKSGNTDLFILRSLLPGAGYDVHVSKLRLQPKAVSTGPLGGVIVR